MWEGSGGGSKRDPYKVGWYVVFAQQLVKGDATGHTGMGNVLPVYAVMHGVSSCSGLLLCNFWQVHALVFLQVMIVIIFFFVLSRHARLTTTDCTSAQFPACLV